jgi:hypothetical protein
MGERDKRRIADLLELSPAQRALFDAHFEEYVNRARDLVRNSSARLWQASYAAAASYVPTPQPDFGQRMRMLANYEDAVLEAIAVLDVDLFNKVNSTLTDVQQPLMQRVLLRRQRQMYRLADVNVPANDLVAYVEREGGLVDAELVSAGATLWDYEQAATPKILALDKELREARTKSAELTAQMEPAHERGGEAAVKPLIAEQAQLYRTAASLQRAVMDLNHRSIRKIVDSLERQRGEEVFQQYCAAHYRNIFPDQLDARHLYWKSDRQSFPPEKRDAFEETYRGYREKHDLLCVKLMAGMDDINEHMAREFHYPQEPRVKESMRRLRQDMWNLDQQFVRQVRDIVAPEKDSTLDKMISEHVNRATAVLAAAERDPFPFH